MTVVTIDKTVVDDFAEILAQVDRLSSRNGVNLVTVDGPSGAGKTTLANAIAVELGATVVHTDQIVPGWHSLHEGVQIIARQIIHPLSGGAVARARTYDWDALALDGWLEVEPAAIVIIEGCGTASVANYELVGARIWVDAPAADRETRLRSRHDWVGYAPYRDAWRRQEHELDQLNQPSARAHLRVASEQNSWLIEAPHTPTRDGAQQ